jgi:spermidine synthase
MSGPRWIEETIHGTAVSQRLRADRVLLQERGRFQDILVFENPVFGRTLMLDGAIQVTERDEFIYHEMIVHPALFAHAKPRRVLIIGGGDGGTLREVLRHGAVERAVLVEIDAAVVEASRRYLPRVSAGAFDDPRADLVLSCGSDFVRECREEFDVVIIDSTDPSGPGGRLFTTAFYENCRGLLAAGGILVAQSGVPFLQPDELTRVASRLREVFRDVAFYTAAVPTYYGGAMAFAWASDDPDRRSIDVSGLERRFSGAGIPTRYYGPQVHLAAFALPGFVRELVGADSGAPRRDGGGCDAALRETASLSMGRRRDPDAEVLST